MLKQLPYPGTRAITHATAFAQVLNLAAIFTILSFMLFQVKLTF